MTTNITIIIIPDKHNVFKDTTKRLITFTPEDTYYV